jgi:hypothetical protein
MTREHAYVQVERCEKSSRLAARYQAEWVAQRLDAGHDVCLDGPHKHVVRSAAKPKLKSSAQILQEIARVQKKIGPKLYVNPNPFQVQR